MLDTMTSRVIRLHSRLRKCRQVVEGSSLESSGHLAYLEDEAFHHAWMAHVDTPFVVRLAHAQAAWRAAVQPELCPGHLVLGTPPPRTVISYPTGAGQRGFKLDEALAADHPKTQEIVEYWRTWLADRPRPALPPEVALPGLSDALWMVGLGGHSTEDYSLAIRLGLDGLRHRAAEFGRQHPTAVTWYDALDIAVTGVAAYIRAHAHAAERAASAVQGFQASEWRLLAANCRHMSHAAPETFLQAVQLFYFLFMLNGHDSPGRMDQYLWPPLKRELQGGTITPEAAQEVVDCLYLKLAEHVCYGATLGGQLPEGGDATNTLTWLCLNGIRRLRLLSPRTALRWHREAPEDLFAATIHSLATGATFPTIVNDEAMIPAMLRRGACEEHARDYTFCGCGQTIPSGRAYGGYEDLVLNSAKPLTYALHNGRDERSGAQVGPKTGQIESLESFDAVEEAVWSQCRYLLTLGIEATAALRRWGAEHVPDYLRSLLVHSCVERGRDWRAGGADYHEGMVDVVGLTTLADSLMVVKRIVFDERRVSLPKLVSILDHNWAGAEQVRLDCLHRVPKFGNEDPEADDMVCSWLTRINTWLFTQRTAFGGPWGMDIIGWSGAAKLGSVTGATPDGRTVGEPLADCAGPAQGRDRRGITAVLNSMSKLPMIEVHGPLALNLRVASGVVNSREGEAKLAALVRSYLERSGQQVQVSVASAEDMRAAQREPDKYRDLIVRVGGFSAYFVDLDPQFQEDMIARTGHII